MKSFPSRPSSRRGSLLLMVGVLCLALGTLLPAPTAAAAAKHTYYVATSGSDENPGTLRKPFRTIQKCADLVVPGDTCAIRGGTYRETVRPARSGDAEAGPITFRPHRNEKVTISGTEKVREWKPDGDDIYSAAIEATPENSDSQVFLGTKMIVEGRWPNTGDNPLQPTWAIADAGTVGAAVPGISTLTDSKLTTPAGFWDGVTIAHLGNKGWAGQTGTVTSSEPGKLTFVRGNYSCTILCVNPGTRYYLTNSLKTLDSPLEWFHDREAKKLYAWASSPEDVRKLRALQIKQRLYAVDLNDRSHVHVEGLRLFGATVSTSPTSTHNVLDGLRADDVSHFVRTSCEGCTATSPYQTGARDTGIIVRGSDNVLRDSVITGSAGNGVYLTGKRNVVTNNLIRNTGYSLAQRNAINVDDADSGAGDRDLQITHNTIHNTGASGIRLIGETGYGDRIAYNDIFNNMMIHHDGGPIYVCCSVDLKGGSIDHNWTHDNATKNSPTAYQGAGVYLDVSSSNALIHHNVVWNTTRDAIELNGNGPEASSIDNVIYNNTVGAGQLTSVGTYNIKTGTGTEIINNIAGAPISFVPDAVERTNLKPPTDPRFTDPAANDYTLKADSPAIDAGEEIAGVTDGYTGPAPDQGAYEQGETPWVPGCDLPGCSYETVDDTRADDDTRIEFTGDWQRETTDPTKQGTFNASLSRADGEDDKVTITFTGRSLRLHGLTGPKGGFGTVSIDGLPEETIDFHDPYVTHGDQNVWTSPRLGNGVHEVTLRATGTADPDSAGTEVSLDKVEIVR
ncbi:hypothetical protein ACFWRV_01445 [Streptomyces sp. NPDC058576]|uniref:right-handed parallel beta-helix repeat-containing protein n=1 Tax=Streptomyces sp. NPDC058576 TaxID=3346547 RepID=UPI0036587345